jgi:hypothetical protein
MQRKVIKKCFLFTVGSVCRVKRFNWVEKFSQGRLEVADDARPVAEVAETTVKRLLCCGFRHTGRDGTSGSTHVDDMSRNIFSPRFEYHMFYVLYPFVAHLLNLPRN